MTEPTYHRRETGGTPWTIIIGPDGIVRFDGFSIRAPEAVALVERLRSKGNATRSGSELDRPE